MYPRARLGMVQNEGQLLAYFAGFYGLITLGGTGKFSKIRF
jgi:hypothetical protein